jgi:predicted aspartyl protease
MFRAKSRLMICWGVLLAAVLAVPQFAQAFELTVEGGRLRVSAERVPLRELLYRLADYGIVVRIDPDINPSVTASFEDKDLEDGIKSILRPLNSVLIWQPVPPADRRGDGPGYRLAAIQIFKPGEKDRMVDLDRDTDTAAAQIPEEDEDGGETRVVIRGSRIFVPVVLGRDGRKVETTLLFDTGASSIVLHQNVADNLGLDDFVQAKGHGVGGVEIDAKVTRLGTVRVGPFEKRDLRVAIVQYTGPPDPQYNGLLGMNFLWGLKYEIDFDRQVIRWGGVPADASPQRSSVQAQPWTPIAIQ